MDDRNQTTRHEFERQCAAWPKRFLHALKREWYEEQAKWNIEPEDPLPGEAAGDRPSEDRAHCSGGTATLLIENEWLLIASGVVSLIFGALLIVFPGAGALSLVWLIGFYAIILG